MQSSHMQTYHSQSLPCETAPSSAPATGGNDVGAPTDDTLFQQIFKSINSDNSDSIDSTELAQFLEKILSDQVEDTPYPHTPVNSVQNSLVSSTPVESSPTEISPVTGQPAKTPPVQAPRQLLSEPAPSVDRGGVFQGSSVISGDLPSWVDGASGHIMGDQHGSLLNTFEQDDIASTINANGGSLPSSIDGIINSLDQVGGYNQGQPPEKKAAGAYLTLNTLGKMETMPPAALGNENNASAVYGALKTAGVRGDGAEIRSLIEANGGDTFGLTDDQLVDLWGVNEHDHLHAVLFGTPEVYNPVHMTSLNDNDMWGEIPGETGALGGFNDKGEYPQWGWYEDALNFQQLF